MPTGKPNAGFRRSKKYWEQASKAQSAQEIELDLQTKAPGLIAELEKLTKPFECPHCGNQIKLIDKDVAFFLIDHAIGKSKSRSEVDITHNIQLNADQIDQVIRNHLPQIVEIYGAEIRGLLAPVTSEYVV